MTLLVTLVIYPPLGLRTSSWVQGNPLVSHGIGNLSQLVWGENLSSWAWPKSIGQIAVPAPQAGQTHCMNEKQATKVLENQKNAAPKTNVKVYLFNIKIPTCFPPKITTLVCRTCTVLLHAWLCMYYVAPQCWVLHVHARSSPVRAYGPLHITLHYILAV